MAQNHRLAALAVSLAWMTSFTGCVGGIEERPAGARDDFGLAAERVPMRRLTRVEYDYAVLDLLGVDARALERFPTDEAPAGFASNAAGPISEAATEASLEVALDVATLASDALGEIAGCEPSGATDACRDRIIDVIGTRAFRRPLEVAEREALQTIHAEELLRTDVAQAQAAVVAALLTAPSFLYRPEVGGELREDGGVPLSAFELATRLSFTLWSSIPDQALLNAAAAGRLASADDLEREARRMMEDPRFERSVRSFHRQWLGLDRLATRDKDPVRFPEITTEIRARLEEETLAFSWSAVEGGPGGLTELMTSNVAPIDDTLARYYGLDEVGASTPSPRAFPPAERAGILTHGSVMAVHADADQSSPILRGKLVRTAFLCGTILPPPPGLAVVPPMVDPALSTRERFAVHTSRPACASCHLLMDPLGFGLEHYDAIGRFRADDEGHAIDASGEIFATTSSNAAFVGAVELANELAESPEVHRCYATQWLRFSLGRGERAAEGRSIRSVTRTFEETELDIRELLIALVSSDAFRFTRREGAAR